MREEKFLHYLECDIKLTEQQGLADARMEALKELGKEVVDRRQRNWFERNSFALGMATGLAVSTVLLFGAAEVMNAAK